MGIARANKTLAQQMKRSECTWHRVNTSRQHKRNGPRFSQRKNVELNVDGNTIIYKTMRHDVDVTYTDFDGPVTDEIDRIAKATLAHVGCLVKRIDHHVKLSRVNVYFDGNQKPKLKQETCQKRKRSIESALRDEDEGDIIGVNSNSSSGILRHFVARNIGSIVNRIRQLAIDKGGGGGGGRTIGKDENENENEHDDGKCYNDEKDEEEVSPSCASFYPSGVDGPAIHVLCDPEWGEAEMEMFQRRNRKAVNIYCTVDTDMIHIAYRRPSFSSEPNYVVQFGRGTGGCRILDMAAFQLSPCIPDILSRFLILLLGSDFNGCILTPQQMKRIIGIFQSVENEKNAIHGDPMIPLLTTKLATCLDSNYTLKTLESLETWGTWNVSHADIVTEKQIATALACLFYIAPPPHATTTSHYNDDENDQDVHNDSVKVAVATDADDPFEVRKILNRLSWILCYSLLGRRVNEIEPLYSIPTRRYVSRDQIYRFCKQYITSE